MGKIRKSAQYLAAGMLLVALSVIPLTAIADTGTFGSFIGIDTGAGNAWYGGTQPGPNQLWEFDGSDLGDFTAGDALVISGGEILTWKNNFDDVTGTALYYSVDATGTTPSSFNSIGVNWSSNSPFNDAGGNGFSGAGDQKWANITSTPNVLDGLGVGAYSLSVYFEAYTNLGNRTDNNGGSNYVAEFSVTNNPGPAVPEPAAFMLLCAVLLPLAQMRIRNRVC